MRIVVLNCSPTGQISVTMQVVDFVEQRFPQHDLASVDIASQARKLDADEETFRDVIDSAAYESRRASLAMSLALPVISSPVQ